MINLKGYEWATHQPMIRAVMDTFKPKFVLELGVGEYSTPLFLEYGVHIISVENDMDWIEYMKEYDIEIIHHELTEKTPSELTDAEKKDIIKFYRGIKIPRVKPRLLFVDQWAMCRALSVNGLNDKFDLIIYHDAELEYNQWSTIDTTGFYIYDLKSPKTWTTLMTKQKKELKIQEHINNFLSEYKDCEYMYVDTRESI